MPSEVQKVVDAKGLICPEPVMMLHSAVRDADDGDVIKVLATDPSTERDITRFCDFLGHTLVEFSKGDELLTFLIKKKAES
ncbi:sulfurtransferase TusA [Agarilytica rhodophyticola]|uniref:sulfurtransferase TusA n=1 Tax=Agarilytica rhodophyticola TaxID=1737490 RepID=UPI000B3463C8|nr:sulfurtransferase TusA [Agarilytica rhodophyticola]